MSARYAVEVSAAELEVVALALGRTLSPKRVAAKRAVFDEPFYASTGNAGLDAWMAASRARVGAPKPERAAPAPRFPYGLGRKMTEHHRGELARFNETALKAWRGLGYEVEVSRVEGSRDRGEPALDGRNVRVVGLVQ